MLELRHDSPATLATASRSSARRRRAELAFLPAALEIVETPPSPTARLTVGVFVAMFVVAITWACLGKIDIVTTAPGRVVASGRTKVVQPLETSVVQSIAVSEGQHVTAGQALVFLDPTENQAERDRAAHDLMLSRLDEARLHALLEGHEAAFVPPPDADAASIATARHLMTAQAASQAAKLADLDHQAAEKQAELEGARREIARIDATLPMLEAHVRIRGDGVTTGFGNQIDYVDAMRSLVDQRQERSVDESKLVQLEETLASLAQQRLHAVSDFRSGLLDDLAKAEANAAEKQQDLVKAAQRAALQTLRAPVTGTVQELAVFTVGGVVVPAQPLLSVVPDDNAVEVEAVVPNREVGFVHPGQTAEIKVESLEFTRYGLLHGSVTSLSRDVAGDKLHQGPTGARDAAQPGQDPSKTQGGDPNTPPDGDPDYVAHLALREHGLLTEQGFVALVPGMTVSAEIKTGRRRVIDYVLSPLQQYAHDVFKER